jgi:hypothetical protein
MRKKKKNKSILLKISQKNESDKNDDAYKIPALAYNQKKDQLMLEII